MGVGARKASRKEVKKEAAKPRRQKRWKPTINCSQNELKQNKVKGTERQTGAGFSSKTQMGNKTMKVRDAPKKEERGASDRKESETKRLVTERCNQIISKLHQMKPERGGGGSYFRGGTLRCGSAQKDALANPTRKSWVSRKPNRGRLK